MKKIFNYILFINFITSILTVVPVWDFKNSAIELMKNENFQDFIVEDKANPGGLWSRLTKKFSSYKTSITKVNVLQLYYMRYSVEMVFEKNVDFEEVESAYAGNNSYYVCPKGSNHLHIFYDNSKPATKVIPDNFVNNGDWELKCFLQPDSNYLFVSYLNKINIFYQLDLNNGKIIKQAKIKDGLFDYKWTIESLDDKYNMFAFYSSNKNILLGELNFTIKPEKGFEIEEGNSTKLFDELKSNYNLYFNKDNANFYFINYNNITDFQTGYSDSFDKIDINNFEKIYATINEKNPLEFVDELIIEEMKFISYTKYVYYKLIDKNKKITYRGIIDVILNKVIFNTNEEINTFIPFSRNSMMVMTYNKLYKICAIYYNNECVDACPEGTYLVVDTNDKNTCQESFECPYYIMKPDDICIERCDIYIYTHNNNRECGLCKDLEEERPYKLINTTTCLESIPNGTVFINEKLKLLRCANGYKLENGQCISMKCYSTCDTCSESSTNEKDQKCLTCKDDLLLYEGNCVKFCPFNYFKSGNRCDKCDELCNGCINKADSCQSCIAGYYFNTQNCLKCHENCKTCEKGGDDNNENCQTCKDNYYLVDAEDFGKNCVSKCPKGTILDDSTKKCITSTKNDLIIKVVLIILFILLGAIIIFIIVFCIRRYSKRKNAADKMLNDINEGDLLILQ